MEAAQGLAPRGESTPVASRRWSAQGLAVETRRIALVRHGETAGQSSIRYYGATDVPLSAEGRAQLEAARQRVRGPHTLVAASSLTRAWVGAQIVAPGRPIRLLHEFREIDFGHWEGLTAEEIAERDPAAYDEWQRLGPAFDFPGGESRRAFRERVLRGFDGLLAERAPSILIVAHKGVVRTITEDLSGVVLPPDEPRLADVLHLFRDARNWSIRSG